MIHFRKPLYETLGAVMTRLIEKNMTIPTRKSEIFSTASDGQTTVEVHVLQGEREMATGNKSLGRFDLSDIPPAPRGVPQIEVSFDIDANGILNVSAKDKATGKEQSIVIKASSGLSDDEVEQMIKDAEAHADEDKKARELVDIKNTAENMIHATEKSIADLGDKVDADEKAAAEAAITELKAALEGGDKDAIEAKTQALTEAAGKIAEKAYAEQQPQGEGHEPPDHEHQPSETQLRGLVHPPLLVPADTPAREKEMELRIHCCPSFSISGRRPRDSRVLRVEGPTAIHVRAAFRSSG